MRASISSASGSCPAISALTSIHRSGKPGGLSCHQAMVVSSSTRRWFAAAGCAADHEVAVRVDDRRGAVGSLRHDDGCLPGGDLLTGQRAGLIERSAQLVGLDAERGEMGDDATIG